MHLTPARRRASKPRPQQGHQKRRIHPTPCPVCLSPVTIQQCSTSRSVRSPDNSVVQRGTTPAQLTLLHLHLRLRPRYPAGIGSGSIHRWIGRVLPIRWPLTTLYAVQKGGAGCLSSTARDLSRPPKPDVFPETHHVGRACSPEETSRSPVAGLELRWRVRGCNWFRSRAALVQLVPGTLSSFRRSRGAAHTAHCHGCFPESSTQLAT